MQRPLRVLAIGCLLAMLLLSPMMPGASAGTQAAPEVTDAALDVKSVPGDAPLCAPAPAAVCAVGGGIDMTAAWIGNETASAIEFHVFEMGAASASVYTTNVHFKVAGIDYAASATLGPTTSQVGAPGTTPGGVAANASIDAAGVVTMVVPRSAIGDPPAGGSITDIYVENFGNPAGQTEEVMTDRAPDTGVAAATYNFTMGGGAPTGTPGDMDGDLLNDTWEEDNFGNLDANATDDPDADGCNNACEFQHGADPNNADTDGDGVSDGDEVQAGTDPATPDGGTTTTSTSGPPTTTTSSSGPPPTGTPTTGPATGGGGDRSLGDRFKAAMDSGYLIIAAALALVVIVLSLIARGARWGL